MERRVSRSQLHSPESTPPPSPASADIEKLKTLGSFEYVNIPDSSTHTNETAAADDGQDGDEEQLAFQLFATTAAGDIPGTAPAGVHRISLRSPTPTTVEAAFVKPNRDIDYYLATSATGQAKDSFATAAVTGEDILARSHSLWPGSAYPWKIIRLPAASLTRKARCSNKALLAPIVGGEDVARTHKRKGKKARVKIRTKLAAESVKVEAEKVAKEDQELAEREKRTRRNREKKAKRKAKEKAEKARKACGGEIDAGSSDVDDIEMDVDES